MGAIDDYISSSLHARRTKRGRARGIGAGNPLRHLESDTRDIQNSISEGEGGGRARREEGKGVVAGRERKKAREGRKIFRRNDERCRNAHKLAVLTTVLHCDATGAPARASSPLAYSFSRDEGIRNPYSHLSRTRLRARDVLGASGLVSSSVPPSTETPIGRTLSCQWIKNKPERGCQKSTSRYIKAIDPYLWTERSAKLCQPLNLRQERARLSSQRSFATYGISQHTFHA